MTILRSWSFGMAAASTVLVACGGSASSTESAGNPETDGGETGVIPCGSGTADDGGFVCSLDMPVQGGLSGVLDSTIGCGSIVGGSDPELRWRSPSSEGDLLIIAHLAEAIPVDQLGTFALASLEIMPGGLEKDAGTSAWKTPAGTCSITITRSVCSPTGVSSERRALYGNGSCSQPAAPEPGTNAPAITIGAFVFVGTLAG